MPIIGGIMSGLVYWFLYGNGMQQIDQVLTDRRNAKLRLKSESNFKAALARSIKNPADADTAVDRLAPLLREKLDATERADLERMLEAIAVIQGGPTDRQERLIARTVRVLAEQQG